MFVNVVCGGMDACGSECGGLCVGMDAIRNECSGLCVGTDVIRIECSGLCVDMDAIRNECSGLCVGMDAIRIECSGLCVGLDAIRKVMFRIVVELYAFIWIPFGVLVVGCSRVEVCGTNAQRGVSPGVCAFAPPPPCPLFLPPCQCSGSPVVSPTAQEPGHNVATPAKNAVPTTQTTQGVTQLNQPNNNVH